MRRLQELEEERKAMGEVKNLSSPLEREKYEYAVKNERECHSCVKKSSCTREKAKILPYWKRTGCMNHQGYTPERKQLSF